MTYYFSKRWRLKFRRDPDAGRVLFIGPVVINFDVVRRAPSKHATAWKRDAQEQPK